MYKKQLTTECQAQTITYLSYLTGPITLVFEICKKNYWKLKTRYWSFFKMEPFVFWFITLCIQNANTFSA